MKTVARLLVMSAMAAALTACNRQVAKDSTLKFKLPESSSSFQSVSAMVTTGNWGVSDPSALSEINCYAVVISDTASLATNSCLDSSSNPLFNVSEIHGLFPAGSEVNIQTSSGTGKTIRLLGMKATSAAACSAAPASVFNANPVQLSMPNVIGQKMTDLVPGFNEVTIYSALSATKVNRCVIGSNSFGPAATPPAQAVAFSVPAPSSYINAMGVSITAVAGSCSDNGLAISITGDASGSAVCTSNAWSASLDFSSASEGVISITAAHGSATQSLVLQKDTIAPAVAFGSPAANSVVNAAMAPAFNVSGTCESGLMVVFSGSGGISDSMVCAAGTFSKSLDVTSASNGPISINAVQTDAAGNASTMASRSFIKNTLAATVAFSVPMNNNYLGLGMVTFDSTGSCSDNGMPVSITGALTASGSCSSGSWTIPLDLSPLAQGPAVLTVSHGLNIATQTITVTKDTIVPTVAWTIPAPGSLVNAGNQNSFAVGGTCSENGIMATISGSGSGSALCTGGMFSTNLNLSAPADGPLSLTLSQVDLASNSASPVTLSLTKNTVAPAVISFLEANPYSFQTRAVGASVDNVMTITNSGAQPATGISGYGISAPYSFKGGSYPGTGGTCGGTLAPGNTCYMFLNYAPTTTGTFNQAITLSYNDGIAPQTATWNISTNAVPPAVISISDGPTYDYGNVVVGSTSDKTFTLTNTGGFLANSISEVGMSAPYGFVGGSFPGTGGNCNPVTGIPAGASCTVVVRVSPAMAGVTPNTMQINYIDGVNVVNAQRALTSTGVNPASLNISNGPTYDFGNIYLGAGGEFSFTVTNLGQATATGMASTSLTNPFFYKGGTYPGAGGTCASNLTAGGSCTIVVTFLPIMAGVTPDTLTVNYNDGASAQNASRSIQGMGMVGYLEMAIGENHVCGRRGDSLARCWAYNYNGPLGNGSTSNSLISLPVNAGYTYLKVSAGGNSTCGIKTDNSLYCWGNNGAGQLGIGNLVDSLSPALVTGGLSWKEISVGYDHTCGITTSDALYCWGDDSQGELGNGAAAASSVPVLISGTWKKVSAGWDSTCAINSADNLYCWGTDASGQIGNGAATGNVTSPTQIGAATYKSVSVGGDHACAVTLAGQLYCWGLNTTGQLGDNTTTNRTSPVQEIGAASYWEYVVTGGAHTCAKTNTQAIKCWGSNVNGVTGLGLTSGNTLAPTPVSIAGNPPMRDVFANYNNSCAIEMNGQLYCWGQNNYGQVGTGSNAPSQVGTPTPLNP